MANSTIGTVLPLIITFILLVVVAVVGFIAYQIACDVADKTSKKMEKKNVSFSKDGLKVGVKEVSAEQVGDSTQKYVQFAYPTVELFGSLHNSVLMKAWNASEWPAYQSKMGWGAASPATTPTTSTDKRKP